LPDGVKQPALTFTSSAAKCYASDVAMEVTTDAAQLTGRGRAREAFDRAHSTGIQLGRTG
jgi:alkylation response protein AidB-like acyl-CoA dehydrogenase